jgi:hypothetical protein
MDFEASKTPGWHALVFVGMDFEASKTPGWHALVFVGMDFEASAPPHGHEAVAMPPATKPWPCHPPTTEWQNPSRPQFDDQGTALSQGQLLGNSRGRGTIRTNPMRRADRTKPSHQAATERLAP